MNQEAIKMETEANSSMKEGFENYISKPTTRLLISTIPQGDHKDALMTILKEAYDMGFKHGQGFMAASFLQKVLEKEFRK